MKRTLMVLASMIAAAGVMAQGTVKFATKSGTSVDAKASLVDRLGAAIGFPAGPATVGQPGYYVELLGSADNTSYAPLMGTKIGTGFETSVRGIFLAAGNGYASLGDWALTGVAAQAPYWFKVVGYYATTGSETWSNIALDPVNNIWGQSMAVQVTTGGVKAGAPDAPAAILAGLNQPWTIAVPEPSVLALGLLGVGAFLLRRRS